MVLILLLVPSRGPTVEKHGQSDPAALKLPLVKQPGAGQGGDGDGRGPGQIQVLIS
jgi:hypothetical protein